MAKLTGNKGEWSEIYVLLRLLGDGKIYSADENIKKNEDVYIPILKIFREELLTKKCEYSLQNQGTVKVYLNDNFEKELSTEDFAKEATYLYEQIISHQDRAF